MPYKINTKTDYDKNGIRMGEKKERREYLGNYGLETKLLQMMTN